MVNVSGNKIVMTRGDTLLVEVSIMYNGEPYTPLPGDRVRFALKRDILNSSRTDYADDQPLILKEIPVDTMILELEPEDTKPLAFATYAYDVEITFTDGRVYTFISDKLTLTKEVH
jgi:hypothetical protein